MVFYLVIESYNLLLQQAADTAPKPYGLQRELIAIVALPKFNPGKNSLF